MTAAEARWRTARSALRYTNEPAPLNVFLFSIDLCNSSPVVRLLFSARCAIFSGSGFPKHGNGVFTVDNDIPGS